MRNIDVNRPGNARNALKAIVLMSLVALSLAGCVTLGHDPGQRQPSRGKLSDAMDKASNSNHGSRTVAAPSYPGTSHSSSSTSTPDIVPSTPADNTPPGYVPPVAIETATSTETTVPTVTNDNSISTSFGVAFARGQGAMTDFHFTTHQTFQLSAFLETPEDSNVSLYILFDSAKLKPGHKGYDSINGDVSMTTFGAQAHITSLRSALFPGTSLSTFFAGGIGGGGMTWNYANPLHSSDGQTFNEDSVDAVTFYVGTGLKLKMFKTLILSTEIGPQLTFWSDQTGNSFDNDVFRGNTSILYKFEVSAIF